MKAAKAAAAKNIDELKEIDPEGAAEADKRLQKSFALWNSIDYDLIRKYIGPSVWQVQSTADGFVASSYTLSAQPAGSH